MKRRIYALMLVVAMLAMTLVGCGSDTSDTTNTTNDATVNTEVEESGETVVPETPDEDPADTPEVEEPVVEAEPTPDGDVNGVNETINYEYAHDFTFPEGMNGFTKQYLNEDYPEWSLNETHYVDINGNEMNFEWEGPAMLGENAGTSGKTLILRNGDDFELRAWNSGYSDGDYEQCVNLPKETWISFADENIPYEENGYYNVETTDNSIIVTFKVSGNGYEGYNYYVLDGNNNVGYQFAYFEKSEIYDDARAMFVINSIEYWNYIP